MDRRTFIVGAGAGLVTPVAALAHTQSSPTLAALKAFVPRYMTGCGAPGLTLGLANAEDWSESAQFGFADLECRRAVGAHERFHIGSITKSFTALMILQLVDEGRIELRADIKKYLPSLALKTGFGAVTVHHLLCHASGLPSDGFAPGWHEQTIEQAFAPGTRFHYSNLGYGWLGEIIVACGAESWTRALRRRILEPLGMTETSTLIGAGMRQFEVPSYTRREDDRPYPPRAALTRAAPLTFDRASGCIASTAADMNRYIAMLARGGEGLKGRLLSRDNFVLMTASHIDAAEFGPGAGYGYGWMIDQIDGKKVIRHTGGMESFMSSIHIDVDAGFGAFASINAQQNYRPVPVTAYAVALYRATKAHRSLPKEPAVKLNADVQLGDYAGSYTHADGRNVTTSVQGDGLALSIAGRVITLESLGDDKFASTDTAFRLFTFVFSRSKPPADASPGDLNAVIALAWCRDRYMRGGAMALGPAERDVVSLSAAQLGAYEGLYANGGSWVRCVRVIARDGRLWVDSFDGLTPLVSLGAHRFHFADEASSPEIAEFSPDSVSPRVLSIAATALERIGDAFMELV